MLARGIHSGFPLLKVLNCVLLATVAVVLLLNAEMTSHEHGGDEIPLTRHRRSVDTTQEPEPPATGGGASYTRWGRTECPAVEGTELVYSGVVGGQNYDQTGGAANYLCLPLDPIWANFNDALNNQGNIYGSEYEFPGSFPLDSGPIANIHQHNVPCAVCRISTRSSAFMLPARNLCYPGWTLEYWGYLATSHYGHKGRTEYICLDEKPEADEAGYRDEDGVLLYSVEGRCGSLPCPPYVEGRELTCAVCSK